MKNKNLFWIFALNAMVYWLQDFEGLPGYCLFNHFKTDLHWTQEKVQFVTALLALAWIPKILWGFLIDNYRTKKFWIAITLIVDFVTILCLGIYSLPLIVLLTLIFFNNTDSAIRDVTADAIMCKEGKKYNLTGKIQSCQWITITLSGIVTSLLGGYLADHYDYRIGFLLVLPFYFICVLPLLMYKESKKPSKEECCGNCKFILECAGNENNICDGYGERYIKKTFIDIIKPYKELFKNKSFLLLSLFIFLYKFSPGFGTALTYIQINNFKWSYSLLGRLDAISMIMAIFGYLIYGKISEKINIKKWLIISVWVGALSTLLYLYFTPISSIAYRVLFSGIGAFFQLLLLDLMAKKTIRGLEAATFAFFCGINNLANTASGLIGAWFLHIMNLNYLIIISALFGFVCLSVINKVNFNKEGTDVS